MSEAGKQSGITGSPAGEATLEAHYPQLFRFLSRALRGAHQAQDLAQDIYLRFLALPHREQVRQPRAYLYRIATNLLAEYRLRERRAPVVFDSELAEVHLEQMTGDVWKDAMGEGLQLRQHLEGLLARMPPTQRAVTVLWARDGLSLCEIARRTGLTPQTTRKYLTRAIALLKSARHEP